MIFYRVMVTVRLENFECLGHHVRAMRWRLRQLDQGQQAREQNEVKRLWGDTSLSLTFGFDS